MALFDASVFLIFFILIGRVLEAYAKSRVSFIASSFRFLVLLTDDIHCQTGDAIALLGSLRPDSALLASSSAPDIATTLAGSPTRDSIFENGTVVGDALAKTVSNSSKATTAIDYKPSGTPSDSALLGDISTTLIPASHLEISDLILLQAGSLPPTDGVIVSGTTTVDESSLTGESKPVMKKPGDQVFTGTVNIGSAVLIKVEVLGDETMIEKIVRAVGEAQNMKSPVEYLAEKVTGVFVPIIVCCLFFSQSP